MFSVVSHRSLLSENTRFSNNKMYYDRYWLDDNFKAVEQLNALAEQNGLSLLEMTMKWCAMRQEITSIIIGVSRLSQLEQNIALLDGAELPRQVLDRMDEVWRQLPLGTRFPYNR